jgi:hypothetical protein
MLKVFKDGAIRPASVTPASTTSLPRPGQAFRDKSVADRGSFSQNDPQLSAVAILIAGAARERKRPGIEKPEQTVFCSFTEPSFARAPRRAQFGCIDVGNADLLTAKPERIPIDNAVRSRPMGADRKPGCMAVTCRSRSARRSADASKYSHHNQQYSDRTHPWVLNCFCRICFRSHSFSCHCGETRWHARTGGAGCLR